METEKKTEQKTAASAKPAATQSKSALETSSPMHSFDEKKSSAAPSTAKVLIVMIVMAALGVGTGYGIASMSVTPGEKSVVPNALNPNAPAKGDIFGDKDASGYEDTAEGVLKEGGIEGEGQYHLEREGGESQNVYMTSSTVDLSKLVDKKVKVWGATQTAQHAGWLMDVGKVQVL